MRTLLKLDILIDLLRTPLEEEDEEEEMEEVGADEWQEAEKEEAEKLLCLDFLTHLLRE